MATEDQYLAQRKGGDITSRALMSVTRPLTMVAGATVSDSFSPPAGSQLVSITTHTATAISGSPTTINFRVGTAAAGQQVVADVDVKAQGRVSTTIVAAFDDVAGAATYFSQIVASGGTNPAGTVNVRYAYYPPVV